MSLIKLLPKSCLIICGYSTLAYEAAIFGVQSVRLTPYSIIPTRSGDCRIPEFYNSNDFNKWFEDNKLTLLKNNNSKLKTLAKDYFYINDTNASKRFWRLIEKIETNTLL